MSAPLLELAGVSKSFPLRRAGRPALLQAVSDVSLALEPGETLGIVGESGSGKTTLARLILRLIEPSAGSIRLEGREIATLPEAALRPLRPAMQAIFQDPYASLNPRMNVSEIIGEPLRNLGWDGRRIAARVARMLGVVGLSPDHAGRYPHAFSGGQRQRIGIARALAPSPKLIVADEAVSALDVSIQAQILNLIADIQRESGVGLVFISHNLAVIRHVSARVAVMYLGRIVELAPEAALFAVPRHPYTRALMAAVPEPGATRRLAPLAGEVPSPIDPPSGCAFHPRCALAGPRCRIERPQLQETAPGHLAACHFPGQD